MEGTHRPEPNVPKEFAVPDGVTLTTGTGGLPLIRVDTGISRAGIYLHGAHVVDFQKAGDAPLLFMSARSRFAAGEPIRGGVPVCFPWFGARGADGTHGFARTVEWKWIGARAVPPGVALGFRLPALTAAWNSPASETELWVTITDRLAMELTTTNRSDRAFEFENCLHTYFAVGDIDRISLAGLNETAFLDFARGANGARRPGSAEPLKITEETNRVYPDTMGAVEIRDESLRRTVRVEKSNSRSTVVWNPWTTQKMPDDFDPAEYRRMICVESGNVKENRLSLLPGQSTCLGLKLSTVAG